ncbi:hypothetical protein LY474_18995 [Myxococcus stipitatus]|uniref:hypothetical protein n=1 Tax=Myxococcus stipitatus TaxID=83455 RepID=UPI001F3498C3|nr:hypothetical protein [Myxococcus stipitatus]MCE9669889.1 hypothetical protein [Myxococcus stipitatus]
MTMPHVGAPCRVGLIGWWLLANLALVEHARAEGTEGVDAVLAGIDARLTPSGARRVDSRTMPTRRMGTALCEEWVREPGAWNRDFLCDATTLLGRWSLENLRADGGSRVSALLEVRRFVSRERGVAARRTALERYGGGQASLHAGAISWCFLDVFWTEEVVYSLWYGCHISLPHVKALQAVRAELLRAAEPFAGTGVVGVAGAHSGWSFLLDEEGRMRAPLEDGVRFQHFARAVNVAEGDVLWLRERPQGRSLGAKLDKLPATASCVPVVFVPPHVRPRAGGGETAGWAIVKFNGREGWVNRRYLSEQPLAECAPR